MIDLALLVVWSCIHDFAGAASWTKIGQNFYTEAYTPPGRDSLGQNWRLSLWQNSHPTLDCPGHPDIVST
jgi:hypothetical protein